MKPLLVLSLLLAAADSPAGQGGVVGVIVVDGEVAPPAPLPPGRDACCQAAAPVDQSVVVGPDGGLASVLVSVEPRRGESTPPADGAAPTGPVVLTNRGCAFTPRLVVARVGQTLVLQNDDPTMHNVNADFVRNRAVNVVVAPDGRRELPLERPERRPVAVRCNVHPFMRGWVAVRDDPYAAATDATGRFELPPLPAGAWRLRFWHEGAPLAGLAVGGETTDDRGELLLEVPDGGLDLGELRVAADQLISRPLD